MHLNQWTLAFLQILILVCISPWWCFEEAFYSWIIASFQIILPMDNGFYFDRTSIKLCILSAARSDIAWSLTVYSFSLILFEERFLWSHGGLLSPSNFGLKTTPANKFDKGDQAWSIGLYTEYLAAYVDTERRSKFSSWKNLK